MRLEPSTGHVGGKWGEVLRGTSIDLGRNLYVVAITAGFEPDTSKDAPMGYDEDEDEDEDKKEN